MGGDMGGAEPAGGAVVTGTSEVTRRRPAPIGVATNLPHVPDAPGEPSTRDDGGAYVPGYVPRRELPGMSRGTSRACLGGCCRWWGVLGHVGRVVRQHLGAWRRRRLVVVGDG
jgi:hypothetical protein